VAIRDLRYLHEFMSVSFKFGESTVDKRWIATGLIVLSLATLIVISVWLLSVRNSASSLQTSIEESQQLLLDPDAEWSDLSERLDKILQQSYSLQSDINLLGNFSWTPFLGSSLEGAENIIEGSVLGLESLLPVLDRVGEFEGSILRNGQLIQDILMTLEENRSDLYYAADQIDLGTEDFELIENSQLLQLGQIADAFRFIADFSLILPEALGMEGLKRYLVLGQTADEVRPVGGYVSTIWVLTVHQGELVQIDYRDTVAVDDLNNMNLYPAAPMGLRQHMQTCCLLMRDVSWEPDFPSVARMAEEIYFLGQGERVDGVIAVNQWTLQAIVDFLGELYVADEDLLIQPQDFQAFLQERTDEEGRGYSQLLLDSIIDQLGSGLPASDVRGIAELAQDMLASKLVMLYFDDDATQEVVESKGWAGAITDVDGDYLSVFDSNVGWSKVDGNIARRWVYEVALELEGAPKASLTLDYLNQSGPNATGCDAQWMASRGATYEAITHACYWNYFRIYVPRDSRFVYTDPMPLPEGAIHAVQGSGIPGEDTLNKFAKYSKVGIGGLMVVPAAGSYTARFLYQLPPEVIIPISENRYLYSLTMQSQPGVMQVDKQITINLPDGHRVVRWYPEPSVVAGDSATWIVNHLQDARIEVEFEQ